MWSGCGVYSERGDGQGEGRAQQQEEEEQKPVTWMEEGVEKCLSVCVCVC